MPTCGRGLADQLSREFQDLDNFLQKAVSEKLSIGASVTQKIKRRGQSSTQKSRVLALTDTNTLYLLKPADKKGVLKIKKKFILRSNLLRPGSNSSTVELLADEDEIIFSMATEAERDFFLQACTRGPRRSIGAKLSFATYSPSSREDWTGGAGGAEGICEAAATNDLLTLEDYETLSTLLTDTSESKVSDIRQLKERIAVSTSKTQLANSHAIINGETDWSGTIDNLEMMALHLSSIQQPIVQMQNNLGSKSENIKKVEQERAVHEKKRSNYELLENELDFVLQSISEAQARVSQLQSRDFKSSKFLDSYHWVKEFESKQLHKVYNIAALDAVNSDIQKRKRDIGVSLKSHLLMVFSSTGTQLASTSAKLRKKLRWKSHYKIHTSLLEFLPLMPEIRQLGLREVTDLCRAYSSAFKAAYNLEITNYFTILKNSLQRTKHKPVFYIGENKKVKALEMLSEMHVGSSVGGSNYAASEVPTLSVARSGVSNASSDGADEPPSRLTELGIVVYRSSSNYGGSSYAGSRCGSRNSLSAASDGLGAESYCTTTTTKSGKEKILPHAALIMSISTAVDIILREQEFLEQFFGLDSEAGKDGDLVNMLTNLLSNTGGTGATTNMIVNQLESTLRYMEKQCDMMCLITVSIVVAQLKDCMSSRSSFIATLLAKVEKTINSQLLVWKTNQTTVIDKYRCDIKHTVIVPCFLRFGIFVNRIVDMLKPLPLEANYTVAQDVIHEIVQTMDHSLKKLCSTDEKYGRFFFVKNAGYFISFLEERKKHASEHMKKILGTQFDQLDNWKCRRDDDQKKYIISSLVKPFDELWELVEWVDDMLNGHAPQEIACLSLTYSYQNVTAIVKNASDKRVREGIMAVRKRQHKHYFEHTSSSEHFLTTQFNNTWEGTLILLSTTWTRFESVIGSCYPDLVRKIQITQSEVNRYLKNVANEKR